MMEPLVSKGAVQPTPRTWGSAIIVAGGRLAVLCALEPCVGFCGWRGATLPSEEVSVRSAISWSFGKQGSLLPGAPPYGPDGCASCRKSLLTLGGCRVAVVPVLTLHSALLQPLVELYPRRSSCGSLVGMCFADLVLNLVLPYMPLLSVAGPVAQFEPVASGRPGVRLRPPLRPPLLRPRR